MCSTAASIEDRKNLQMERELGAIDGYVKAIDKEGNCFKVNTHWNSLCPRLEKWKLCI